MAGKGGPRPNSGRKPGSKNEKTLQWEELGQALVTHSAGRAKEIMEHCDDETFMDYFTKLLEYFKPKQARTEIKQEGPTQVEIIWKRER